MHRWLSALTWSQCWKWRNMTITSTCLLCSLNYSHATFSNAEAVRDVTAQMTSLHGDSRRRKVANRQEWDDCELAKSCMHVYSVKIIYKSKIIEVLTHNPQEKWNIQEARRLATFLEAVQTSRFWQYCCGNDHDFNRYMKVYNTSSDLNEHRLLL